MQKLQLDNLSLMSPIEAWSPGKENLDVVS